MVSMFIFKRHSCCCIHVVDSVRSFSSKWVELKKMSNFFYGMQFSFSNFYANEESMFSVP